MVDPIALTLASLENDMQRMNVLANNAANALTPGFKREFLALASQAPPIDAGSEALRPLSALPVATVVTDFKSGTPRKTGVALDISLLGEGYFEVRTGEGLAYTRLGALSLDEKGRLVTQNGYPVSGLSGEIVLSSPAPVIERNGRVFEKGIQVAQIQVVSFDQSARLRSIGGGLLVPATAASPQEVSSPSVVQGHLESSNVDSAREMISLVETFRHFESGHRVLQAYDDIRDKIFRNLGQF